MNELFEIPSEMTTATAAARAMPVARVLSERITVSSKRNGKAVEYARLSDEDHRILKDTIEALWNYRMDLKSVLREPSTLWGSHGAGKGQDLWDILEGLRGKMHTRHPFVRGRQGEDLTIKQLEELNRLIDLLNARYASSDSIAHVPVP